MHTMIITNFTYLAQVVVIYFLCHLLDNENICYVDKQ